MERMKKMRKMLGLGRKKKARQEEEGAPPPPEPQSRSGAATAGAYRVRSRELGPLHRAAAEGDLGRLRQLLTQKQDPDQRDRGGRTPLHLACANGCTEIVALLVDHKCQLNIYDGDKRSPLMKAVQCQQELCAIYLLEHGADPNFVDVYSNTALHFAALNSSISIAKHLLDHNANIEAQNTDGSTPLIVAVVENNREMVEFLLKKGASVHATDNAGRTPLLIATSNKKRDLTHVLLSYGSDVSHKDDSGWSAQDYAMLSDDPILLQYIAEYSKQKNGSGKSDDQNVFSVLNVPDRTGDAGITLGAPATNIEVLEDHSSGDSVRDSGKTDDTWPSSEEEELDFSVKKPQKPSLARLMSVSQQFKTNDEKSSLFRSELVVDSQRNSSISDAGGVNESFSRPLFHVQSFPQPAHSSPGSFSTQCQMASRLSPKQEGSFEEEEDEEEEEEEEDGKNPSFMAKNLNCHAISLNQISSQDDSVQKASLRLGADEEEDKEKAPESPWDSEGVSESPRKPAVDSSPASPAKIKTLMPAVAEEPCDRSSANAKPEMAKMNLEHEAASSPLSQQDQTRGKQKSDLMEELGLDDADDIEDASDWDSASVSQSLPCVNTFNIFSWGECSTPAQLPMSNASPRTSIPARVDDTPVTETREAAKGPSCSKQNAEELEHGDAKGKSIITAPSSREKLPPGKQNGEHLCLYNGKKTGTEIDKAEDEGRPVDATFWEERYEKLWVAKEKREVKSNFKSITAELKLKFGEIDINQTKSRSSTEGPSHDVFSSRVEGVEESLPSHPSEATIRIWRKGETGPLKPVVAGKDPDAENSVLCPQDSKLLCPPGENQSVEANQERSDDLSPEGKGFTRPGTDKSGDHSQKCPGDLPVAADQERVADTIFRTFLKQRKTQSASHQETLPDFNAGVHTGQCLDPELGNRGEPPDKDPRKEWDEALERDVARFKNEVGMLRRAFLALEKEKARLQKEVEEEKRKQELAETKKAENTEKAAANVEEKMEQRPSADENHPLATRDERKSAVGEDQGTDVVSSSDGEELVPVPHKGNNPTAHAKGRRKREKKRRISKPKFGQQTVDKRHQPQDESSLSEASLEDEKQPEKMVNRRNKICKAMDITNNCEDLTPSSDTATEDIESPTSVYGEAMMLIEQLTLDSKADAVSLFKIQNIFHGYERVIEREKGRSTQLLGKVKKLENEKKDQQRILDEVREAKCMLDHQTVEQESDISSLKFSLKQEEEKRTSVEMQYEKTQEQLRKKEEQCCKQVEEKQQLEIMLRGLEVELRTLKNRLAQVEEERDETQRQLSQEQKARALQEGVLNTHLWRQKEWEEESKKAAAKHYEMSEHHNQEEELMQQNQAFQEELAVLRAELDRLRIHHEEKDSRYLEENEALKEKIEDLKKELKLNEEALTQTIFQYNGQINVSKTEAAVLASKLEHTKENKERLELELDSFRARVSAAIQELEQSQVSRKDLELTLRREREEWLRSKDQLSREVGALQEANGSLSQQLGRAESKINSLENELQLATHGLREKSLLFEGVRRDLDQAQGRAKELEHALDVEKEQRNKQVIKQDSLQERLAQLQSENLLLRQQLEDVQNKGVLKEKVVTDVQEKFSDIFGKLQADTEKQLRMVEERNQELVAKCHDFREQVLKYEAEKADREGTVRQLQQELADSLKKQSMSEASLEVSTRYRSDLEEDKQQLQKEIDRIKSKLQESEEQYLQSERRIHDLRNALDSKEREASVTSQKLHDLLAASSGANNAIKQLEGHIQRLEVENARLEATTTQQSHRIEILQKDLQDSLSVHSRLEELITGLQTAKINLEEELHQQAQKQTTLSAMAQDTHSLWEEELKSRSKLGIRLSELDREKAELMAQCENERKKVKKLAELKRSVELRLDQEMKRNHELQKEYNGIKKLAKVTKRKLKEYESSESSWRDMKTKYSENEVEIGKLRKKVDELSYQLEAESTRCTRLELANDELRRELSSMKTLRRNYEELQKSKQRLEEEMAGLQTPGPGRPFDLSQVEQYKRDVEERAKQEVIQKLEEVNLFLQTQAASQDTLEQIRATNQASLRNQLEKRIQDLESELSKLKRCEQEGRLQKELAQSELERCKSLYSEELKTRKTLGRKLDRAQEKLAEANAKLFHERHRSKSLLASSFLSGSLSAGPMRETVPLGNLGGGSLAFGRPLSLGSGFVGPSGSPLASKSRVEAYLAKMQMELETTINKELDQAKAELDAASARVSPIGSLDGSSKNLNPEPDQVAKAAQEYLDVLKKNYMI
nr:ankyrin repeat domain-containing protein 26-like isoform X4 [Pogona vitticeps]